MHDAGGLLRLCCPALRPLRPVLLQPAFKLCDGTAEVVVARQENALGETVTLTDRNGNVHTLSYDVLGRLVADAVTTLGAGVDGSVRRIEYGYDVLGNLALITSYDAATGGNVVNQVKRDFNGLGQLVSEWQEHTAVVTGSSPRVQYAYSEMAGGANHSRLTSIIYPNGRVLNYNYAAGLDDTISRLSSLSDSTGVLESYDYLGESVVVARKHPQPGIDLSYIKRSGEANGDAGDPYTGLDRFGRIVDQRWLKSTTGSAVDRLQYTYDRNGNRLSRTNLINTAFSESYSYDNLNQLIGFTRGSHSRSWDYDAQGNWEGVTTNGSTQMRTHNAQNEITGISGATTPTYDANGNLTRDETGRQFVYDAWNRLVAVKDAGGTTLKTYAYDGLHRRISETAGGVTTDLYYSDAWQVLEERVGGQARVQYVWSPVYVDALVLRDRDTNGDGTLDERLWVVQDANYNVTALFDNAGNVVERYVYDPFGQATILDANWTERAASAFAWVYLHQGGRFDVTSGLYHFRYRDYSSTLGRWTSLDPIRYDAGDVNLYRVLGNGLPNRLDPLGLFDLWDWLANDVIGTDNVRSWDSVLGHHRTGWFAQLSNGAAGMGDTVSMGLTGRVRQGLGYDDVVDYHSGAYAVGEVAGTGVNLGLAFVNPCAVGGSIGTGVRVINGIQAFGGSLNAGDNLAAGNYGAAALDLIGVAGNSFQMLRPCFPGEVQVLTRRGWVRWDALTTSDEVLSLPEDQPEGELAYRPVEEVFRRWGVIWEVTVAGRVLRTTAEHPFWVRGKGWTAAKDLRAGDELRSHDRQWLAVEGVRDTGREEAVYNCRVAEYHTYFVGDAAWGWSVWAHNSCYSSPELARAGRALREGRTNEVIVRDANEARELFFREFRSGHGVPSYRDTTGWSKAQVDVHGKAGTYHWDTVFDRTSALKSMKGRQVLQGHYDDGKLHNYTPHLQIHTFDGRVVRILFGG